LDADTQEMILYGSLYPQVKAYEVEIGYEITLVDERIRSILAYLDIGLCDEILRYHAAAVRTDRRASDVIGAEDVGRLGDTLYSLREIERLRWARAWLIDRRDRIRTYARLHGTIQQSAAIRGGVSIGMWKDTSKGAEQNRGPIKHPHSKEG